MRVTGSSSLMMTPLDAASETQMQENVDNLSKLLSNSNIKTDTGSNSKEYKEIQDIVTKLTSYADGLLNKADSSIFSKAEAGGDTSEVIAMAKNFMEQYNELINKLNSVGTEATDGFVKELSGITSANKELLNKVGFSISSDGTVKIDEKVFSKASIEDLKKLFQGEDSMASKITDESIYAGTSAALHSMYGTTGNYNGMGQDYGNMLNMAGSYLDFIG